MGANCVSCSDEQVSEARRQEFDPAKHGSRSIFGPSPQEDFLQRQRSERKKHLKDRRPIQVTGAPAPLFQKRRVPASEAASPTRVSAAGQVQSVGSAHLGDARHAAEDTAGSSAFSPLDTSGVSTRRGESGREVEASKQVRNPSSVVGSEVEPRVSTGAKKPKKNLFFMPET